MRLLIVDDEWIIRKGLTKMVEQFRPAFQEIVTAENGIAALEKIRSKQPDLVLTDLRMPKMDGFELCKRIQEEYPRVMTVVISGYGDFEYAQQCIRFGVKHYLLKPVDTVAVHEMLQRMVVQPKSGYIAVSRYIEWIDRMEQYIWGLQINELHQLIQECLEYWRGSSTPLTPLKEMLLDFNDSIVNKLRMRGYEPQIVFDLTLAATAEEALDGFEQAIRSLADGLLVMRSGHYKDPVEEVKAYIDLKLSEEITLDQMAAMIGLTPTYLSALFKKNTNQTFVQYRIHRRMSKARELLALPHLKISDIALQVGYEDYPHFTKTFKKVFGLSPSEYRAGLGFL